MIKLLYILNIAILLFLNRNILADEKQDVVKTEHENAIISARQGKYSKAIPILEGLVKSFPTNPKYAGDLVTVLSWKEDDKLATEKFEYFLSKEIKLPIYAYKAAAISYKRRGSFSKAEKLYKFIIENAPNDSGTIREMMQCLLEKKEKDKILDLTTGQPGKESLETFIMEQLKRFPGSRGAIELTQADFLLEREYYEEAKKIYAKLESDKRLSPDPQIGLCKIAIAQGDYTLATEIFEEIYEEYPNQTEILFCKATLDEQRGDYVEAYETYLRILTKHPNHQEALNGKIRALIAIGAYTVAKAEIEKNEDQTYEHIKLMLKGDVISFYVNSEEHRKAVKKATEVLKVAEEEYRTNPEETLKKFIIRVKSDRIISLRKLSEMKQVIKEYESLKAEGAEIPFWVVKYTGDAYLYLKQPGKALEYYRKTLKMKKELGFDRPSDNFELKMAIYYALLENEQLSEAGKLIEEIDAETPTYRIQRGLKLKNWYKFEVTLAKGWYLIYQNKLGEALQYFKDLQQKAPFNGNIKTSLAYTKLFRGWPRNAHRDFSVSRVNDPNNKSTEIGYARTLDELDEWRKARKIASDLLQKYPKDLNIQRLNRDLHLEEMPKFTSEATFSNELDFESSGDISLKLEYPVYPKRKIYTETKWLFLSGDDEKRTITRSYLGLDWRLNRDLTLTGSASLDYNGENPGFMGGLVYQPTDELTFRGSFDSYSLSLPPKALLNKVKGKEATFSATYRHSENFYIEGEVAYLRLSDANNEMKYAVNLKKTITSNAYIKTQLGISSSLITNSKDKERSYYSPKYRANVIAVPELELLLYRKNDFKILSRTFFGIGPQWESAQGTSLVGFVREEIDWTVNDQLSLLIGTTLSKDTYDGDDTFGLNIDCRMEYIIDYDQVADLFK